MKPYAFKPFQVKEILKFDIYATLETLFPLEKHGFQTMLSDRKKKALFTVLFQCSCSLTHYQNFRLVQIETNCRRHFKVHLKWKIGTI